MTGQRPSAEESVPVLLQAQGIHRRASSDFTLGPISLALHRGEITAVIGASGCGKSSLLRVMAGMDRPDGGVVKYGGQTLNKLGERKLAELRSSRFAFIFQDYMLLDHLTIAENIALPAGVRGEGMEPDQIRRALACVGLQSQSPDTPVSSLSGGQQQRVAIARALATGAQVLFADEPTGNLDPKSRNEVIATIKASMRAGLDTVLLVTHDPVVAQAADRIVMMDAGHVSREFPSGLSAPQVEELLLGQEQSERKVLR